ncbi:MAG: efflux RND transporter periplasmic adaptor subunit [Microgenomates group bacterium]
MKKVFSWFKNTKNRLGKKFWIILAVIILLIVLRMRSAASKITTYDSSTVSKGELLETISTTGRVKADEYANLTFQSGGRLSFVSVKKGDTVYRGQALAGLDTVILNASYQQALNNYRNYQAAAQSTLDTLKDHSGDETYAQKATRTAAEVARDNAYDAVKAAEQNLRYSIIFSPFKGIIAEATPTFAGANVTPVTASYVVVNPETTYFDSEIEETDLPKVKVGQKVKIKLDAYPEEVIEGKIDNIGIVAFTSSTGGNAYSLRINLPKNKDFKYKVGMEGDVDIILETISDVLKVPTGALVNEEEKNYVWVYNDGKVKRKEVTIGGNSNEETEIKSGVDQGETIISEPSNKFKDGQKVKI